MAIAKEIGGFSLFEAEDLRKAIGKKIHKLMASLKDKFIEGCIGNDTSDSVARQLWDDIEKAQDYSFNKAHAACYALISYRTAWLRANHPCEYMAALISSVMSTKDRVPFYVNACHELGIEVLPPDVNESQTDFAVVDGKIRFGLNAVKGVGELACRTIIAAREEAAVRVDLGLHRARRPVRRQQARARSRSSSAARCPGSRMGMLQVLEQALSYGQKQQADRARGPGLDLRLAGRRGGERPSRRSTIRRPADESRPRRAAPAREGDAGPLRLRAPAVVAPRPDAAQDRRDDRRARTAGATARSSLSAASSRGSSSS